MTDPRPPRKKRHFGRNFLLTVLALVVILYLALPTIVHYIANQQLPKQLAVDATLGDVKLSLLGGKLGLRDLVLPQPAGFGPGNAVELGELDLSVDTGSLRGENQPIVVREIALRNTTIHAIMDAEGRLNLSGLAKPAEEKAPPEEKDGDTQEMTAVLIERIVLENVTFTWEGNPLFKDKDLAVTVKDITLNVDNLLLDPARPAGHQTPVTASFSIPQGERPDARFALHAVLGALGEAPPAVNATVRLTGFQLDTIDGLLVKGARTALGGNAFDLAVDYSLDAEQHMDGLMVLTTDKSNTQKFKVGGTLEKPVLPITDLFGNVLARPAAMAGKLATDTGKAAASVVTGAGKAATEVAGGAGKAAVELGKGAGEAVGNVGKNAGKLVGSLFKGDVKGAGEALKDGTVGTVSGAAGAVGKTGGAAVEGVTKAGREATNSVGEAASHATGATSAKAWTEETPQRFEAQEEAAKSTLETMAWPPKNS